MTDPDFRAQLLKELRDLQVGTGALMREVGECRAEIHGFGALLARHEAADEARFSKLHEADDTAQTLVLNDAKARALLLLEEAKAREVLKESRRYHLWMALLLALVSGVLGAGLKSLF